MKLLLVSCCHANQWKVQSFCSGRICWSSHSSSTLHRQVRHGISQLAGESGDKLFVNSCNPLENILYIYSGYVYNWVQIWIYIYIYVRYTHSNIHSDCIIISLFFYHKFVVVYHGCRAMEALPSKPIAGYILCGPVVCFGCKVSNEKKQLVLLGIYYTVTHTVIFIYGLYMGIMINHCKDPS